MDAISDEALVSILGHLSERDRIRLLSTCKRMREWLKKRRTIAEAAFKAFKAHCMTDGWKEDNALQVSHNNVMHLSRSTHTISTIVCLGENGLIHYQETSNITLSWGRPHPASIDNRFFVPWFHELTSRKGDKQKRVRKPPTDVVRMLLDASPRLV